MGIAILILGMVVFIGVHCVPMLPAQRRQLIHRVSGEQRYRGLFSLVAAVGLLLIIIGTAYANYVHVYVAPSWGRHLTHLLVLVAFILLPAAHMKNNIKRFTAHPMNWGVILWGVGHLLANGDLASIILFGGFAVYAAVDIVSANARGATTQQVSYPMKKNIMVVVAGVVTYAVVGWLHPWLFGMPAFY